MRGSNRLKTKKMSASFPIISPDLKNSEIPAITIPLPNTVDVIGNNGHNGKQSKKERFTIFSAKDALKELPPIDWLVENLITENGVVVFFGDPGTLKTYLLLYLGISITLGIDWLGKNVKQGPVLFIDEESGPRRLTRRIQGILTELGGDENTPFHYISLGNLDLRKPNDIQELKKAIQKTGAIFVVIDALSDVIAGAEENSVKEVQPAFMALRDVMEETKCTIVVIHHSNKAGGYRGSSAIKGAVDLMVKVEKTPESGLIQMTVEKARDAEPQKITAQPHFDNDKFWLTEANSPLATQSGQPKLSGAKRYVVETLFLEEPMSKEKLQEGTDYAEGSISNAVDILKKLGLVERSDDGGRGSKAYYQLTEEGRNHVDFSDL